MNQWNFRCWSTALRAGDLRMRDAENQPFSRMVDRLSELQGLILVDAVR